jgi:tRNA wybutosine-synthesizing protein 3
MQSSTSNQHSKFAGKKAKILQQLSVPSADYTDASPKGTVDAGIRDLIDEINAQDGLVTTSSCAGRVSVFLEGRKVAPQSANNDAQADISSTEEDRPVQLELQDQESTKPTTSVGGKGGGGTWLFVSHDPIPDVGEGPESITALLGLDGIPRTREDDTDSGLAASSGSRLIHFKFEPMVSITPRHCQL